MNGVIFEELHGLVVNILGAHLLDQGEKLLVPLLRQVSRQLDDEFIGRPNDVLMLFGGAALPNPCDVFFWEKIWFLGENAQNA